MQVDGPDSQGTAVSTRGADAYYPEQPYYAPGWGPASPPPRRRGPARAVLVAVLALLVLALVAGAVLGALTLRDTRPLGEVEDPTTAATRRLDVGHCIAELPADGAVERVRVVPCAEPHEAEVVGVLDLPGGGWPGRSQVQSRLTAWCEMDTAQQEAGFRAVVWAPSEAGWDQGDRQGLCLAWTGGGSATGSLTADDEVAVR